MPCRCDGMEEADRDELQNKLDKVTQNLCFVCGEIEGYNEWAKYGSPRLILWWQEHLRNDTKRVTEKMQEMIRRNTSWTAGNLAIVLIREAEAVHPVSEWHKNWFNTLADQQVKEAEADRKKKKQMRKSIAKKLTPEEMEFIQSP